MRGRTEEESHIAAVAVGIGRGPRARSSRTARKIRMAETAVPALHKETSHAQSETGRRAPARDFVSRQSSGRSRYFSASSIAVSNTRPSLGVWSVHVPQVLWRGCPI